MISINRGALKITIPKDILINVILGFIGDLSFSGKFTL